MPNTVRYHQGLQGPVYVVDGVPVRHEILLAPVGAPTHVVPTVHVRCEVHGEMACDHVRVADQFRRETAREALHVLGIPSRTDIR